MEEQSKQPTGTFGTYLDIMKAGKKQVSREDFLQEIIVSILGYLIQHEGPIPLTDLIEQVGVEQSAFMEAFPIMMDQGLVTMEGEDVHLAPEILDRL
jgi:predicted transcriptional regulator